MLHHIELKMEQLTQELESLNPEKVSYDMLILKGGKANLSQPFLAPFWHPVGDFDSWDGQS